MVGLLQDNKREFYEPYIGKFKKEEHVGRAYKYEHLLTGLLRCNTCGCSYTSKSGVYRCVKQVKKYAYSCTCNEPMMNQKNLDVLVKDVAYICYKEQLEHSDTSTIKELKEEVIILKEKLMTSERKLEQLKPKAERIKELYINGDITKAQYESQKTKWSNEYDNCSSDIELYQDKIKTLENMMSSSKDNSLKNYLDLMSGAGDITKDIVVKFIKKVQLYRIDNYRTKVLITTCDGVEYEFEYNCKKWHYTSVIDSDREIFKLLSSIDKNYLVSINSVNELFRLYKLKEQP